MLKNEKTINSVDWKNFASWYGRSQSYWFIPKVLTFQKNKEKTLKNIYEYVNILKKNYEGKIWNENRQKDYLKEIQHITSAETSAFSRIIKKSLDLLGFAWVNKNNEVIITDTGNMFIDNNLDLNKQKDIIEQQIWKFQLSNPFIHDKGKEIYLFPHAFLVKLLLDLDNNEITEDEYALFISRAHFWDDFYNVKKKILEWRNFNKEEQKVIIQQLIKIPVPIPSRRRSTMYNTISLNKSYALNFFCFPKYIDLNLDKDYIRFSDKKLAFDTYEKFKKLNSYPIKYKNELDWLSFYGQDREATSTEDAINHYRNTSDTEGIKEVRDELKNEEKVKEIEKKVLSEKKIEDHFEKNPEQIEKGFKLIGRQFSTSVGPIDLLCEDINNKKVIVELKKDDSADKVVGQALRYRGFFIKYKNIPEKNLRVIILTDKIDEKLKLAVEQCKDLIELKSYKAQIAVN